MAIENRRLCMMDIRRLGLRLEAVASFIPAGARVADVGTDHGLLPIWLRRENISPYVIASDLRPGPLSSARKNAEKYHMDGISFRLCSGLSGILPEEVDTVVIAGMSGETIRTILADADWDWQGKRLVLEANTKHPELLTWLYQNGMHVDGERLPKENGRYYRVYSAVYGRQDIPRPAYLWGGFRDSPYADRQAVLLRRAVSRLEASASDLQRKSEYIRVLEDMRDAYHWRDLQ